MDAGPHRALPAIEEMRLQLAVDRLVARGELRCEAAFEDRATLAHALAERGLLGLDLEALRREARQQRRQARAQAAAALRQRDAAAAQWARAVRLLGAAGRPGNGLDVTAGAGSARRA
jgi:hypothetical protein